MSSIAISELNSETTNISDNDLLLLSKYDSGNQTYTSTKLKTSNLFKRMCFSSSKMKHVNYDTSWPEEDPRKLTFFDAGVFRVVVPYDSFITYDFACKVDLNYQYGQLVFALDYNEGYYTSPNGDLSKQEALQTITISKDANDAAYNNHTSPICGNLGWISAGEILMVYAYRFLLNDPQNPLWLEIDFHYYE